MAVLVREGKSTKWMSRGTRIDTRHNGRLVLKDHLRLVGDPVSLKGTLFGIILDR